MVKLKLKLASELDVKLKVVFEVEPEVKLELDVELKVVFEVESEVKWELQLEEKKKKEKVD